MYCAKCGSAISKEFKFCPICGQALVTIPISLPEIAAEGPNEQLSASSATVLTAKKTSKVPLLGAILFGTFSLLALLAGIGKGLPIIAVLEAIVWAIAACLWYRKQPAGRAALTAITLLAVAVVSGEVLFYLLHQQHAPDQQQTALNYAPPDQPNLSALDQMASCREAKRIMDACYADQIIPIPMLRLPSSLPLDELIPEHEGSSIVLDRPTCRTEENWYYYCDEKNIGK